MLEGAVRQADALRQTDHRPWPLSARHWLVAETLQDQLFLHWPVPLDRMQDFVPGLEVDTFEGQAWLGLTAFTVGGLRTAGTPPVPLFSSFQQVNVRTYVRAGDRPGVYFLSLDAASRVVAASARRLYQLPFERARITVRRDEDWVLFESARPGAALRVRYRPTGPVEAPAPGTLDHFLIERFCLYSVAPSGKLVRSEIHHAPWPLQPAEAELGANTYTPAGLLLTPDPHVRFSARQDILAWPPEAV